jgi:hypothetical protein
MTASSLDVEYKNLDEFYPFYLSQHAYDVNRIFHYCATLSSLIVFAYVGVTFKLLYLLYAPLLGYGFAWVGHFFFEKNKPATFKYPIMSLISDYVMFSRFITGSMPEDFKKYNIKNIKSISWEFV